MFNENEFAAHVNLLFVKPVDDHLGKSLHAAVGIAGESGELLDAIKKTWIYNKPLDKENVLEECGDILFYLVAMLSNNGYSLGDAAEHNVRKLAKRYPTGYTDQAAQQRADKANFLSHINTCDYLTTGNCSCPYNRE